MGKLIRLTTQGVQEGSIVYAWLKQQVESGKIDEPGMAVIIDSFSGLALPALSKDNFDKLLLEQGQREIGEIANQILEEESQAYLFKALVRLNLIMKGKDWPRKDYLRRIQLDLIGVFAN